MINKTINCLIIIILSYVKTYSQEFVPPIQSYTPSFYSAGGQNWDIGIDSKGIIYSANNQGLLIYDGLNWELFPLESHAIIRSVYPYKNRIYTGSYNEFGYWKRDDTGHLTYTSLSPLMADLNLMSDEFWQIIPFKNNIYFRSFGTIYKYTGEKIVKFADVRATALEIFKNHLVAAKSKSGLSIFNDKGQQIALPGNTEILQGKKIVDLKSYGDSLYIGTSNNIFIYSGAKITPFPDPEISELLSKYELNHLLVINPNEIILGTLKNGIIHYKNGNIKVYNRTSGLQNNTVLGMLYANHKLWLSLDKGIDAIDLHSPFSFYTDKTGEIGTVYDIKRFEHKYYLASNTGTYTFNGNSPKQLGNAQGHTWNLQEINGILYANHNSGTYRISKDSFIPIDERTGSYSFKNIPNSNKWLLCHYTGLSIYDPDSNRIKEMTGINFPVKKAVFGSDGSIWAAHPYEGIYHLVSDGDTNIAKIQKIKNLDKKANFRPAIYKINDQLIVYENSKWYKYNPFKDNFEPFKEFSEYEFCKLIYADNKNYIFLDQRDENVIYTDLKNKRIVIPQEKFDFRLVKPNAKFIRENDSILLVPLNDGFAKLNVDKLEYRKDSEWVSTPFIKNFSNDIRSFSLATPAIIPFPESKNLKVKVGMPDSEASALHYKLSGEDSIEGSSSTGIITFRNLTNGNYKLEVSSVRVPGVTGKTATYLFQIEAPWYLSAWMKLFYILLAISLMVLIFWFNRQKLIKHQAKLEAKFAKEHNERINELEKSRLMQEIDMKRKELANTTMMAAKKNEVLMEIQGELSKDKNKFSNQFRMKHIMNKINHAVKNKDEWKVFETNFNEVHEDFFKEVLKKHPNLTSKDLKLCSYLKMNLSSKEIAPLMGISVRGVEVHRYRLRKKMNLESDTGLTKFLIKNF